MIEFIVFHNNVKRPIKKKNNGVTEGSNKMRCSNFKIINKKCLKLNT